MDITKKNDHFSEFLFWYNTLNGHPEAHLEPLQRCRQNYVKHLKWCFFSKIVNDIKPLTIWANSFILEVWRGSNYASALQISKLDIFCENCERLKFFLFLNLDFSCYCR